MQKPKIKPNYQLSSFDRFAASDLREFTQNVFVSQGVCPDQAAQAADVLCTADEWGIRSHGLARLRSYYEMLSSKAINPSPEITTPVDLPSIALLDGGNGLGLVIGMRAHQLAVSKAKETGIGWVSVTNSNHFGIAGYYCFQGATAGTISIAMTNSPALVSPFGGIGRRLGTNPIAAAFPTFEKPSLVIDLATSAISLGRVETAQTSGVCVPSSCISDCRGQDTCDPADFYAGGSLMPLGGEGDRGGHKGYCLASLVDLLCGVFPGASWGPYVPAFRSPMPSHIDGIGQGTGHLFISVDTNIFGRSEDVRRGVDSWIDTMHATTPRDPSNPVLVPGERERDAERQSHRLGVPIYAEVQTDLRALANQLSLIFPRPLPVCY